MQMDDFQKNAHRPPEPWVDPQGYIPFDSNGLNRGRVTDGSSPAKSFLSASRLEFMQAGTERWKLQSQASSFPADSLVERL